MTLDQFQDSIEQTHWFSKLGQGASSGDVVAIERLHAETEKGDRLDDFEYWGAAQDMEFLPSVRDQDDPFYGQDLTSAANQLPAEQREALKAAYRLTLKSLRGVERIEVLRIGRHDLTNAAKGAATYAMRAATMELLLDRQGIWMKIAGLYFRGHWPCGYLEHSKIVVY